MKTLILIRHAKSSWDNLMLADHERPLNDRGRKAAAALGGWFNAQHIAFDQILSSTAQRCQQTHEGIQLEMGHDISPEYQPSLYHASADEILQIAQHAKGDTIALFGHNPGIGNITRKLVYCIPDHPDFARYPTGATSVINFDIHDWSDLCYGSGELQYFITPKELML